MKTFAYSLLLLPCLLAFKTDTPAEQLADVDSKIKFTYVGDDAVVEDAVAKVRKVLRNPKLYAGIEKEAKCTFTKESPDSISVALKRADFTVRVRGYHGGDDTKTLAYVTSELPTTVFINTSKTGDEENRSANDVANTIIHETIHVLDRATPEARFGHGGNSANGKRNSAPYWIGAFAEQLMAGDAKELAAVDAFLTDSKQLTFLVPEKYYIHVEETEAIDDDMIDFTPPKSTALGGAPTTKSAVKKGK